MPIDGLADPIHVLLELPGQAALADPAWAGDRYEPGAPISSGRRDEVLEQSQFLIATDERGLGEVRTTLASALGDDPQGPIGWHGRGLAFERVLAGRLEFDRRAGRPHRRLTHEDRAGLRDRLEAGRRIDEVTCDHPLVRGADRHGGLTGQDARPGLDRRAQGPDGIDQVQGGTDAPLGVILARRRSAPDGHDGVADELLDRAPVASDDVRRDIEVAGEGVPDVLGVAPLGERGESDQIREQDADQAAFRDGAGDDRRAIVGRDACGRGRETGRSRTAAFAAELGVRQQRDPTGWARPT